MAAVCAADDAGVADDAGGDGGEATSGGATDGAASGGGDIAAGKTSFEGACQGCHLAGGTEGGGVGPKLAGLGLPLAQIKMQIQNGKGAMPGGLLSGTDLDNAAAYVESIQK